MRDTHFIYLSNTFDKKYYNYNKVGNISDLSTIGLIMDAKLGLEFASQQEKENLFDLNLSYFYSEFNRQIKFVTEYQDHYKKYIPFILPKKVIVNFIDFERKKSEICKRIDDNEINNKLEAIFNYYNNNFSHETIFKIEIAKRLLIMLLNYYINKSKENPRIYSEIKLAIKSIKLKNEIWQFIKKLFEKIQVIQATFKETSTGTKKYLDFMYWIDQYLAQIGDFRDVFQLNSFIIPTFKDIEKNVGIQEFFYQYHKTVGMEDYLNFSWGLSTGENTLISLFSRLFSITEKLPEGYYLKGDGSTFKKYFKKAIILIDEADLTFHPEWQQKYIKSILEFLEDIYQECKIQIIITTHSPIILSDIPKYNVIFLKKYRDEVIDSDQIIVDDNSKHYETFGANISTLFYDSFFMKKGSIGEFAKETINYVIKRVKPINGKVPSLDVLDENRLRKIIYIIGDEVLKNKLNEMLDNCINKSEINQIEIQIRNLEMKKRRLIGEVQ